MTTVAVIMGGPSAEHEVSVASGNAVMQNIDTKKYTAIKIVITKKGVWQFDNRRLELNEQRAISELKNQKIDVVFIALHGTYGEDGALQKVFEDNSIKFTGSNSLASDLAMDKERSNKVYQKHGMEIPKTKIIKQNMLNETDKLIHPLGLPLFVKPVSQGSSVGAHVVKASEQLLPAIKDALKFDDAVMVQQYIKGREFSCGVLEMGGAKLIALPPTELIPVISEFFDYKAKYETGGTKEITPPELDLASINKIQRLAYDAHIALGCSGYSRTDMMMDKNNIYMIETNTLPGLTPTSILPQQAAAFDMTFSELIDVIIMSALKQTV